MRALADAFQSFNKLYITCIFIQLKDHFGSSVLVQFTYDRLGCLVVLGLTAL